MKLVRLTDQTGYIETAGAAVPLHLLSEGSAVLIDSGTEPDEAFMQLLEDHGLRVRAVVCTHLHFDHTGNNEALVSRHGAQIFAHPAEISRADFVRPVRYAITPIADGSVLEIDGAVFRLLHTPGHTAGHITCVTPDGVCCVGDALMTQDMLERAKIPYMEDVDRSIISMEDIRELNYPWYIAAHRGAASREEITELVEYNIRKELELYDLLREKITEPMDVDRIIDGFIRASGVRSQKMVEQDYVRRTAQARLFALVHAGEFIRSANLIIPRRH